MLAVIVVHFVSPCIWSYGQETDSIKVSPLTEMVSSNETVGHDFCGLIWIRDILQWH